MSATIVLGGQWGDEGKGKITDALAQRAQFVVRANGGNNAGHTVETSQGVFKLHLVPSGILTESCTSVIGAGVVIDPFSLAEELAGLQQRGVDTRDLVISDRAHLVLPWHQAQDKAQEQGRGEQHIGTTLRGIGPAYADKAARSGLRMADLLDESKLWRRIDSQATQHNRLLHALGEREMIDPGQVFDDLVSVAPHLRPHIGSAEMVIQDALDADAEVIIECAQGAMLDIDYGTYPFVTSSSPTAAGACQGAGVAPSQVKRVIAVYKAYSTRVGSGAMPTELMNDTGNLIRGRGREYGTTTGRPRRTGWFDAVAARYTARLNGVTEAVVTLLDVLDTLPTIDVCTSYEWNGLVIDSIPARADQLAALIPQYQQRQGWEEDITGVRESHDLPANARAYVDFISERIATPVSMIGVGPAREQLITTSADAALLTMGA